jgi:hypothetical protein
VISIKEGIGPRRSSRVCSLIAALVERKRAHRKGFKQRSMVDLGDCLQAIFFAFGEMSVATTFKPLLQDPNVLNSLAYFEGCRKAIIVDGLKSSGEVGTAKVESVVSMGGMKGI